MVLNIEFSQKIITPEIPGYYYSRDRLLKKILLNKSKRLILITAPAGYGKTSFSVEYYHKLSKELKLWISLSPYDNSIENFFLLFALAFENNFHHTQFGSKLKAALAKSQNISAKEKINTVISSFSSDLYSFLKSKNKQLSIFLDDFHNIDDSDEVCAALNYLMEYLPANVKFVLISRRDPKKINYPKFLAKGWLGRISQSDLSFNDSDTENFIQHFKKKTDNLEKELLEEFLKTTQGWVTAIQLLLMTNDLEKLKSDDILRSHNDIFAYFTNEIYRECSDEEKKLMLILSYPESFTKNIIENVFRIENGYQTLRKLYESNVFINKQDDTFRFHELLRKFLNKIAEEEFSNEEICDLYTKLGRHYLNNKEWREDYIALNYLILGRDHEALKQWIKLNASDKLLLIHSSGLFNKIEDIEDEGFKNSLEYILLKVNTFIYKDKDVDKALEHLRMMLRKKFEIGVNDNILLSVNKIKKQDVNYYVELLMLICNCNFLREGISKNNISISEHILKFDIKTEQEVQFIVSLVKSYITAGENAKSRKYILRLKEIFNKITSETKKGINNLDENSLVESLFSMLIFFDYGDYKTGNNLVKFIMNNFDFRNFDLSNYSQVCFALFTSYNTKEFEKFYEFLNQKNSEKNQTIFSAYKNQFEFQTILRKFLNFELKSVVKDLEIMRKETHLKNYLYFIDSLILYTYNIMNQPVTVIRLTSGSGYNTSKTRLLILLLEANLLVDNTKSAAKIISEINVLRRENFTLFNQAVILFCECYMHALNDELKFFREKFRKFLNMCIEFEYDNYLIFRIKANKLSYVFNYAVKNKIESVYLKNIFSRESIQLTEVKSRSINIDVHFLNNSRIYINGKELPNIIWQRSKSKTIFLYMVYQSFFGNDVTKETLIDDILYSSKSVNYDAIADVEINNVRKAFKDFLSQIFSEKIEKDVIVLKEKKYLIASKNIDLQIRIDVDEFKRLSSGNNVKELSKAIEIYQTDFAKDSYSTWAEDIRENLKFIYSDNIHKVIPYFEKKNENATVIRLLEKLADMDYSDEEIMMKLLSIYNKGKDYRKFKFAYKVYEKRLKKEFNVQPSPEMKKFFSEVITNS